MKSQANHANVTTELINKLKQAEKSTHYNFDDIKRDLFR